MELTGFETSREETTYYTTSPRETGGLRILLIDDSKQKIYIADSKGGSPR